MSKAEAKMAVSAGADALGLVSEMPSGPGVLSLNQINEIAQTIPAGVNSFLLSSKTTVDEIVAQHRIAATDTIQLCSLPDKNVYAGLLELIPGIRLVQVIHVENDLSYDLAVDRSRYVHSILLDSGKPSAIVPKLGGTGKTHNWDISRKIVRDSEVPVFLAGGISSENIYRAISEVQPFGIDLCSSVRTKGKLDPAKLFDLFNQL